MQIIRPTERIEVIESKKQCKAGSTGYIAYQHPLDMYNICKSTTVFTKFGNKGKNRIEVIDITTELVNIESMKLTEKSKCRLKERMTQNSIMPRYPDKYFNINSSIKKISMPSKNVIDLDIWDFFGYVCSLSLFMKKIIGNNKGLGLPGKDGLCLEEAIRTSIIDLPPTALANFIYLALNNGAAYDKEKSLYLEHFEDTNNRMLCMSNMYLLLSTLREGVLRYSNYMIRSHKDMSKRIKDVATGKSKLKSDAPPREIRVRSVRMGDGAPLAPSTRTYRDYRVAVEPGDLRSQSVEQVEEANIRQGRPAVRYQANPRAARPSQRTIDIDELAEATTANDAGGFSNAEGDFNDVPNDARVARTIEDEDINE